MTLQQEAYTLIQKQPEDNIRLIINLMRTMSPMGEKAAAKTSAPLFKRTGIANGKIHFPEDFDEHFDDMNKEIAEAFYEGKL